MASVQIRNQQQVLAALKRIDVALKAGMMPLFNESGRALRDFTQKRISTSDGGNWKPVSKWIRAKKNTTKALAGMQSRIKFKSMPTQMELYFESPGNWAISDHDKGFTVGATGKRVTIPLRNPAALGLPSKALSFSFISRRDSVVPARKVWPTDKEAEAILVPIVSRWVRRTLGAVPGVRVT